MNAPEQTPLETDQPTGPRDRPFEPFRVARSSNAKALVGDVLNQLGHFEHHHGLRQRKRRAVDQETFDYTVEVVISDLVHRALTEPEGWIAVTQSNQQLGRRDRYRSRAMSKQLVTVLKYLARPEMEFAEIVPGYQTPFAENRQTTMRAGARLLSRIRERELGLDDLCLDASEEVIILKRSKTDHWDEGERTQYEDDARTTRYRDELKRINEWIEQADIEFDPYGDTRAQFDTSARRLRRYFNNSSFEEGGRLFGGFWLHLPKELRRHIHIEGCRAVTLDYSQMAPRILYGLAHVPYPDSDAYTLEGLEDYRPGFKKVFGALLYTTKPLTRFPKDVPSLFPPRTSVHEVVQALQAKHATVSHLFGVGIGFKVFYVESCILVDVLLALMEDGIVGLPIHDAVVVPGNRREEAKQIMLDVFKRHTGIDGVVEED